MSDSSNNNNNKKRKVINIEDDEPNSIVTKRRKLDNSTKAPTTKSDTTNPKKKKASEKDELHKNIGYDIVGFNSIKNEDGSQPTIREASLIERFPFDVNANIAVNILSLYLIGEIEVKGTVLNKGTGKSSHVTYYKKLKKSSPAHKLESYIGGIKTVMYLFSTCKSFKYQLNNNLIHIMKMIYDFHVYSNFPLSKIDEVSKKICRLQSMNNFSEEQKNTIALAEWYSFRVIISDILRTKIQTQKNTVYNVYRKL